MGLSAVGPLAAPSHAAAAGRSPFLAAMLSFVWPGLGQLYRGRRAAGLFLALPTVALAVVVGLSVADGPELFALRLLTPSVALTALAVVLLVGGWRVVAVVGAARTANGPLGLGSRRRLVASILLVALIVVSHLAAALVAWSFYRAGSTIFEPIGPAPVAAPGAAAPRSPTPSPTAELRPPQAGTAEPSLSATTPPTTAPVAPPTPSLSPMPSEALATGFGQRVNVLLVGLDTGSGGRNTDTLMVASFDTVANRIVMLSLPRDTMMVPLYDGRLYTAKINSFMAFAARHPEDFPDGGMAALVRQMEYLVGVPIDYYASIDIAGFRRLIELAGGVEVDVEQAIHDPTYKLGIGPDGFHLKAGRHHLNSWEALAYVRSRKGTNGSDFERARRQQQVMLGLRHKVADPQVLANLPALLEAASQTVRTNMPVELLPQLVDLLQGSLDADIENIVLGPPTYSVRIPPEEVHGLYGVRLEMDQLAKLSRRLFGDDSRYSR